MAKELLTEERLIQPGRGVGNTTRQMQAAPRDSVFVWVNHHLGYAKDLANKLDRSDLKIVSPDWLSDKHWAGLELTGITLDHATPLTNEQWGIYYHVRATRVRK